MKKSEDKLLLGCIVFIVVMILNLILQTTLVQAQTVTPYPTLRPLPTYTPTPKGFVDIYPRLFEIKENRSQFSKNYKLQGGSIEIDSTVDPIHFKYDYKNISETWKDINTDIIEVGGKLIVSQAPYKLEIFTNKIGFRDDSRKGGFVEVELLGNPNMLNRIISGNSVTYINAFPDIDVKIEAKNNQIIMYKVIKNGNSRRSFNYGIKKSIGRRNVRVLPLVNGIDSVGGILNATSVETRLPSLDTSKYTMYRRTEEIDLRVTRNNIKSNAIGNVKVDVIVDELTGSSGNDNTASRRLDTSSFATSGAGLFVGDGGSGNRKYGVGLFYSSVAIPNANVITHSELRIYASSFGGNTGATFKSKISAHDIDSGANFAGETAGGFDTRFSANTSAIIAWTTTTSWTGGVTYTSPEINTVIQELVDRAGWSSGNNMVIFWEDFDGLSSTSARRRGPNEGEGNMTLRIIHSSPTPTNTPTNTPIPSGWSGTVSGVDSPGAVSGVDAANINTISGNAG